MKRILSFALVTVMVTSAIPMVYAANVQDYTAGTQVVYNAEDPDGDGVVDNKESYTITVPAKLAPGDEGTVVLAGTWAVDRYVTVTASQEIDMVNSINSADIKTLAVVFDGIGARGSNTTALTVTEQIAVADFDSKPLFGEWSGLIEYNAEIETRIVDLAGTTWQMNEQINNYEWTSSAVDNNKAFTYVSCDDNYCGTYNKFYSAYGALSFHFDAAGANTPVYLSDSSAEMFTLPNAGWYLVDSALQQSFNAGDTSVLPALIGSAQKCSAPILMYEYVENDYLRNFDVIDWLYDNAIML